MLTAPRSGARSCSFDFFAESHLGRNGSRSDSVCEVLKQNGLLASLEYDFWSGLPALCTVVQCHAKTRCISKVMIENSPYVLRPDYLHTMGRFLSWLGKCHSIRTLTLEDCNLARQHLSLIGGILGNNAMTLQKVRFRRNVLGDDGLEMLMEGLQVCKRLRKLELRGEMLRSGKILRNLVSSLPCLETLHIGENHIRISGLMELFSDPQPCPGLRELQIGDNYLRFHFLRVVQVLTALRSLEFAVVFRGNTFDEQQKEDLRASLKGHPTLKSFNIL